MIHPTPVNTRDAAMIIVAMHMKRLRKFVESNRGLFSWNKEKSYAEGIQKYFKLHPSFEKVTKHTELNNNGDCSGLIKKLINGI